MDGSGEQKPKILTEHMADPLTYAVDRRDSDVVQMVEEAIAGNRVLLAFQPIVHARNPKITAFYEALVRVLDRDGRIIPAVQFFHAVEDRESGRKLDCLSLKRGLQTLQRHPGLRISINMSARSIGYKPWTNILHRALSNNAGLAERLILEISETSAMTVPEHVTRFMADQKRRGISFAVDNFGAGSFALKHLRDFSFDCLKIDGQFIRRIESKPDNQVLVQALVALSRPFNMYTVAERVESWGEARWLAAAGVDCLQGFCFGAPTTKPGWATRKARNRHPTT